MSTKKLGERSLLFALCIVTAFAVAAATPVVTRSVFDPSSQQLYTHKYYDSNNTRIQS